MLNFIAAVYLQSSIIFSEFGLTLDSLLAGIEWQRSYDLERTMNVPIARLHGVAQASIALLGHSEVRRAGFTTIGTSFVRELEQARDIPDSLDKMPPKSKRQPTTGPFKNIMSTYPLSDIPVVFFLARGDVAAVQRALNTAHFIGSQTTKGFGQVIRAEVWPVNNSDPLWGIVHRQKIIRPVPMTLLPKFPKDLNYVTGSVTWKNPYNPRWPTARVERCMVPPSLPAFDVGDFS